jgi:succinate-acetate transporter protein
MADQTREWGRPRSAETAGAEERRILESRYAGMLGDPMPLGLVAFAITVLTMGTILAGWWRFPGLQMLESAPLLLIFGGIAQLLAAMWCFGRGETLGGTFFGVFGAFWIALGSNVLVLARGVAAAAVGIPAVTLGPLGVTLACLCFVALVVGLTAVFTNAGFSATSLAFAIGLFFLAWASLVHGNAVLQAIAGWAGVISGVLGLATAAMLTVGRGIGQDTVPRMRPWRMTWPPQRPVEGV